MANSSLLDLYNVGMSREPVGGDYPKPGQDLIDRMTMLPIGQYEDGSLTLAWPQMLVDMYEGGVRSFEQGRQLPRVDSEGYYAGTPRAEPLDAFNAASAAPMAGVAGRVSGAVPKGALGSGGSDMLSSAVRELPMDQASRLARAKEMGFNTDMPLYHGTTHEFDAFDPDAFRNGMWGRGAYFTPNRNLAEAFAEDAKIGENAGGAPGRLIEAFARLQNPFMLERPNSLEPFFPEIPGFRTSKHRYTSHLVTERLRAAGHDGVIVGRPGYPEEVLVFDPSNIRSIDAAFDPAQSSSSNLFAANPETASYPSLLLNSEDGQQNPLLGNDGVSTSDILRRYGLLSH